MNTNYRCDFDGHLCYSNWPDSVSQQSTYRLSQNGAGAVTNSSSDCRAGDALSKAVEWCQHHGLEFDAVNDNLPEIVEMYGKNSRKITCDYYIDDRMMEVLK